MVSFLVVTLPFCTFTFTDAVAPFLVLTVMVAVPVFFAVIFPFLSTVAILLLEDFHLAMESPFVSVAFTAVVLFPFCSGMEEAFKDTLYFFGVLEDWSGILFHFAYKVISPVTLEEKS